MRLLQRLPLLPSLAAAALAALTLAPSARAQYPLTPSPLLDARKLSPTPSLSGYISVREMLRHDTATFMLNQGRLTTAIAPLPYLAIRLQVDFSSGTSGKVSSDGSVRGFSLADAYVQLAPSPARDSTARVHPALFVGQFKQPFSLEYLTSFTRLLTADRSLTVDRLSPKRDIGVMGQVRWSRFVTLAGALVNGDGANATANADGRQMALGRLTLTPLPGLALAAKLGAEGDDHLRGYDARWIWRELVIEGEAIHRSRDLAQDTHQDAGGGYVLAAYRVRPWLQPVLKHERFRETLVGTAGSTGTRSDCTTVGLNLAAPGERLRLQLDWMMRSQRPLPGHDHELGAQLIAIF